MAKETENFSIENIIKGYITGFFDAEGMVRIDDTGNLALLINQTYKPVLEKINNLFKSPSGIKVHSRGKDGRKDAFTWRQNSDEAISFLEYVQTYSYEKRKQIEFALIYQKEIRKSHRDSRSGGMFRLSQLEIDQREYFKTLIENLKHETPDESTIKSYEEEIEKLKVPKQSKNQLTIFSFDEPNIETKKQEQNLVTSNDIQNNTKNKTENNVPEMPSDINIGYLAGFFDGEGYIGIDKGKKGSYTLRVAITNSNFRMLQVYEKIYGGKIRLYKKKLKESYKTKYQWGIDINEALKFLRTIHPYTSVKRAQIELAISFQEWHTQIRKIKTYEQIEKAEWYYKMMKDLKQVTGETDEQPDTEYEPESIEVNGVKYRQVTVDTLLT